MHYVMGIDGGQAATTAVVADETGCLLGIGHAYPSRIGGEMREAARMQRAMTEAMQGAVRMADLENARLAAVCVGVSDGNSSLHLPADEWQAVCDSVLPTAQLRVEARSRLALYAVTLGQPGAVVRAGIGTVARGHNAQGEQAQCGGWGPLLGDEGSGYWIARRALNHCCRARDGVAPDTQMEALLCRHLELADMQAVQRALASEALRVGDVACLAEVVSRAAGQGDRAAQRILREAGKELALSALAVLRRLGLEQEAVPVGTVGGVFRAGRAVLRAFRETVRQAAPHAMILSARVPLSVGAACIALETLNVPLREDLLANLQTNLPRLAVGKA